MLARRESIEILQGKRLRMKSLDGEGSERLSASLFKTMSKSMVLVELERNLNQSRVQEIEMMKTLLLQ